MKLSAAIGAGGLAAAAAALAVGGIVATCVPARRAWQIEPAQALEAG